MDDRERVRQALAAALAERTRCAYLGHWDAFQAWAARRGYASAPADPETVAAHLAALAKTVGAATLKVRRAAIGAVHRASGFPDPTAGEPVKRTLSGLVRKAGAAPRQAAPLTATALAAIRATACARRLDKARRRERAATARSRGLADIALCSVMRDALLRRSEAAALTWGDIAAQDDGSGRLTVHRSKTDREAAGSVQYLGRQAMADLAALRPAGVKPGDAVFALSDSQIQQRIAAAARAAGLEGRFSGHSPRVGIAQDLAAGGAALPELMQAGRWSSSAMPASYIRGQAAGRNAAAQYYADRQEWQARPPSRQTRTDPVRRACRSVPSSAKANGRSPRSTRLSFSTVDRKLASLKCPLRRVVWGDDFATVNPAAPGVILPPSGALVSGCFPCSIGGRGQRVALKSRAVLLSWGRFPRAKQGNRRKPRPTAHRIGAVPK